MYTLVCIVRTSDNMIIDNRNLKKEENEIVCVCFRWLFSYPEPCLGGSVVSVSHDLVVVSSIPG